MNQTQPSMLMVDQTQHIAHGTARIGVVTSLLHKDKSINTLRTIQNPSKEYNNIGIITAEPNQIQFCSSLNSILQQLP